VVFPAPVPKEMARKGNGDKGMAKEWQRNGKGMAKEWQRNGKGMAKEWQRNWVNDQKNKRRCMSIMSITSVGSVDPQ
jgi:hypothetical protein